jgi:hypothetical protein
MVAESGEPSPDRGGTNIVRRREKSACRYDQQFLHSQRRPAHMPGGYRLDASGEFTPTP